MSEDNEWDEKKKKKKTYYPPLSGLYINRITAQSDYVNCPVDPGSIQGGHCPMGLTRKYMRNTRDRLITLSYNL